MSELENIISRIQQLNFAMNKKTIDTIIHNGVLFPEIPEYVVKNNFNLAGDKLSELAKEMLFAWSRLDEKYKNDKAYPKNFYPCLKEELTDKQKSLKFPSDFKSVLTKMKSILEKEKENKKEYNKEHKDEIKAEKEQRKEKYGYAKVNGKTVELGNVMVEAPRIFIGRGNCSYRGGWVYRVQPEDVRLNSTKKIPCPIKGHKWGGISKKDTMSIATYDEYVGIDRIKITKTVWFSNKSDEKAENDQHKFDKARLLEKNWDKVSTAIKKEYSKKGKSQQIGLCAYLVSVFGIRAGGSSGARDNGVVGASTLKAGNIQLLSDNNVRLKFVGKDSMDYDNTMEFEPTAYKSLKSLVRGKDKSEKLFDEISSSDVNSFLQSIVPDELGDLSLKTFRTFFGTSLLVKEIQSRKWSKEMSNEQFRHQYDSCVLTVAKKLNHKKTVSKEQSNKIDTTTKEKLKKAKERFKERKEKILEKLSDIKEQKQQLKSKKRKGYTNKVKELTEKQEELKLMFQQYQTEYEDMKTKLTDKVENKEVALNTSKTNYSNPMVAYSLAKYCDKDPKLILSKALTERFNSWIDIDKIDRLYWKKYPNV